MSELSSPLPESRTHSSAKNLILTHNCNVSLYVVLEAGCFVSKYTEFGFAFYMFAAVPLAPRFWGGGKV